MARPIRLGTFYLGLPLLAAQRHGFYERHRLEVEHLRVASSTQQFEFLRDGGYDVIQTSPDNIANYRCNRNNPVGERIDVLGFMGMDYGLYLVLATRPGIEKAADLRGRAVAVDAPASGFAYVLYAILERAGLRRDVDYDVLPVGGVARRFEQLISPDPGFDGTLLSGGYETRAANAGFNLLESAQDIARPYVGSWAAATRAWLDSNGEAAQALVAAYREATAWCFDRANRETCIELLMEAHDADPDLAAQLYGVQLRENVGNIPDAGLVLEGVRNVLELRARFGGFEQERDLDEVLEGMYDPRFSPATPPTQGRR